MHDDPFGPQRLRGTVDSVKTSYPEGINLIALEWAKSTHTALVGLRGKLKQRLQESFPWLGGLFIERFSETLGYEGNFHRELPSESQIIWMLDGFETRDQKFCKHDLGEVAIQVKMTNLETWLLPRIPNAKEFKSEELLIKAKLLYLEESKRLATPSDRNSEIQALQNSIKSGREFHMLRTLENFLSKGKSCDRMGIVIVGTGHLSEEPGSLYSLAQEKGYHVERRWPHEQ